MTIFRPLCSFLLAGILVTAALPAAAQYNDNADTPTDSGTPARLDVRLSQLEEQMRRMEGTIEQLSYQNKQLKEQMDKQNGDNDFRFKALEKQAAANPAAQPQAGTSATGTQPPVENGAQMQEVQPATDAGNPVDTGPQFSSARDHYNYAYGLMKQAKYPEAGDSFIAFTQKYPHDPLIGHAYYWLGETYYARRQYLQAADNFRQGYEAMPSGPKSADNLLKLAMSLEALNKDKEACVVLHQVATKYDNAGSVKPRAEQEMNRLGCN